MSGERALEARLAKAEKRIEVLEARIAELATQARGYYLVPVKPPPQQPQHYYEYGSSTSPPVTHEART